MTRTVPTEPTEDRMDYSPALAEAVAAARQAGALLLAEFHRPDGPRGGGDHADADTEVERLLRDRLTAGFPFSFLGEETGRAAGADPSHVWVVDPNDGTTQFLKGRRGSAVSVGLVHAGRPVLGVVFAFACPDDDGDLFAWAEGCGPATRNGRSLPMLDDVGLAAGRAVMLSGAADRKPIANARCVAPARFAALPSIAYRLALTAAGEAVGAVSLAGARDWDIAAGHALLAGVGGTLVDHAGRPVVYGSDAALVTRRCFGGTPAAVAELAARPWGTIAAEPPAAPGRFPPARVPPGRAFADAAVLSRAHGCLLGQLAGDALGGLVEFRPADAIRAAYPNGARDLADGGTWSNLAGQPTDDSELALMLARTLVRDGRYDPEAAAGSYAHWYASGPFDIGGTTRAALGAAARAGPGARVAAAARSANAGSQANGSLMRVSPLGIFAFGRPAQAADLARLDSGLTHPHPVCRDACAVFTAAIAAAVAGGGGPPAAHSAALAEAARSGVDPAVTEALRAAADGPPDDFESQMGWVLIALRNAFFRLLHAPTLEQGVIDTVMAGGDTDTNAAIAGALLGAVHGRDAVPARWRLALQTCRPLRELGAVHPRPPEFWPTDALELAEGLLVAGRHRAGTLPADSPTSAPEPT